MKQSSCQIKTKMYYSDDFSVDQSVQTNFDYFSLAPLQNYIQAAPVVQLFSYFCIIMFFEPFFLWLCVEWKPLLMLDNTQRCWMQAHSREWWVRVVLKECIDGE